MLTNEMLLKIKQDAQKATPGPWEIDNDEVCIGDWDDPDRKVIAHILTCGYTDDCRLALDAVHIANCDPQTVMELVKMARRYLWLRDESLDAPGDTPTVIESAHGWGKNRMLEGQELDDAIDRAINSQHKEGGEG